MVSVGLESGSETGELLVSGLHMVLRLRSVTAMVSCIIHLSQMGLIEDEYQRGFLGFKLQIEMISLCCPLLTSTSFIML